MTPRLDRELFFRVHAVQRLFEREISDTKVKNSLETGEVIEDYSGDMPEPSRLILGFQGRRPFHVVVSEKLEARQITVITVYIPDSDKWASDFKGRR